MTVASVRGVDTYPGMMWGQGSTPDTYLVDAALFDIMIAIGVNYTGASTPQTDGLPSVQPELAACTVRGALISFIDSHPDNA